MTLTDGQSVMTALKKICCFLRYTPSQAFGVFFYAILMGLSLALRKILDNLINIIHIKDTILKKLWIKKHAIDCGYVIIKD